MIEEKCPKCNTPMVEVEGIDKAPAKLSWELEQGLIRLLECSKCKYYFWQEGHFGNILNKDALPESWLTEEEREKREKYHIGEIPKELWGEAKGWLIERLVENHLKKTNTVAKLTSYFDGKLCLNEGTIKECLDFNQSKVDKVLSDIKTVSVNSYEGLPDFLIADKANKNLIFFVECKSITSHITDKQKLVFEKFEKLGYRIFLMEMALYIKFINFDRFPALINWRDKL